MLADLRAKRALVTGAEGGIGRAIVDVLQTLGCRVHGVDLPDFDLSDPWDAETFVASLDDGAGFDILVNNAGATHIGSILDTPLDEFERIV